MAPGRLEPGPGVSDRAREVDLALSRQLAKVMDDAVTVPGTRIGLGLDAVIGLVPGIGDVVGSALSGVIVRDAIRARVPMAVLAWMGTTARTSACCSRGRAPAAPRAPEHGVRRRCGGADGGPGPRRTGRDGARDLAALAPRHGVGDPDFTCWSGVG